MKNNILGGLVIFLVVVTCLLMIDDISNTENQPVDTTTIKIDTEKKSTDLAIVDLEE